MENASKALLMAGGVLIGMLILTLMVTLFMSSKEFSDKYDQTKKEEAIQQFNVNFTKYLGHELTIHQVVTICNFADMNNVTVNGIVLSSNNIQGNEESIITYKLTISEYSEDGYITKISIQKM